MSLWNPISDVESAWDAGTGAITDTTSAIESSSKALLAGAEWAANPHNWLRVLLVIGGTVAILMGVKTMFNVSLPPIADAAALA